MTTITLQLPDELAARLAPMREQLPRLLSVALELYPELQTTRLDLAQHPAFEELVDFLARGPAPAQIAGFKMSPATQARLDELLDKNREEGLSAAEAAELDAFAQVNHVVLLLKARARNLLERPLAE